MSIIRSPEFDLSIHPEVRVKMFTLETDEFLCKIWNSSNDNLFDKDYVSKEIATLLIANEDIMEGTISFDLSEIMFEITEK
jgi:hypothetical protein